MHTWRRQTRSQEPVRRKTEVCLIHGRAEKSACEFAEHALTYNHMTWLFVVLQLAWAASSQAASSKPELSEETIVFKTNFGDFAVRLYPKDAPQASEQILRLVRSQAYNGLEIPRIVPGFIVQLADVKAGPVVMKDPVLSQSIKKLGVEAKHLKHTALRLTLARQPNDENSGESSFSILLNNAPHLDGGYTVFGEVVAGSGVIQYLGALERFPGSDTPVYRVVVESAAVTRASIGMLKLNGLPELTEKFKKTYLKSPSEGPRTLAEYPQHILYSVVTGLTLLLGAVWFYLRKNQRFMISFILLSILTLTYGLVQLLMHVPVLPVSWGGALTYLAVLAVIKLMSRFENI